ncbi:retention module-containing protein, partial [Simiduia aestuariiviva]
MANAFSATVTLTRIMAVQGDAWVTDANGERRPLSANDVVALNEWLTTGPNAVLLMAVGEGAIVTLGQNETLRFDKAFLAELDKQAEEGSLQAGVNFEAIEQALEEGRSLDEVLPAAAAGNQVFGSGDSAGTGGIRVDLTAERVTPESGFETSTIGYDSNRRFEDIGGRDSDGFGATPAPQLSINPLAIDDIINAQEQSQPLTLTGNAANVPDGGLVTVSFNGNSYQAQVANGQWSATVPAADLLAAADGQYNLTVNAGSVQAIRSFGIDTQADATINFTSAVTADNRLSQDEAAGPVVITGSVTGDFSTGDLVSLAINGVNYTGAVDASGNFSIEVAGADLQADPDQTISASFTATDAAGNSQQVSSQLAYQVQGPNTAGSVAISGNAVEDETLTATISDANGATGAVTYQWFADGVAIVGATGSTLTLTDAEVGKSITVQASYTDDEGFSESPSSTATAAVVAVNDGANVTITGTPQENETLTANVSDPDGATGPIAYQWYADGVAIGGATGNTYTLTGAQIGSAITVQATYTDDQGFAESPLSTATGAVVAANIAPVANDDTAIITDEDTAVSNIDVLGNDTDADGDSLTVTAASATNGSVTINPDGTLSYTPNTNYNGADTISYTISDGRGGTDTATIAVTVNAVSDAAAITVTATDTAVTEDDAGNNTASGTVSITD